MIIQNINTLPRRKKYNPQTSIKAESSITRQTYDNVDYSKIPFCAIHNIQPPKKLVNVEQEKAKLLRQIDEILESEEITNQSREEMFFMELHRSLNHLRSKSIRLQKLNERLDKLTSKTTNPTQADINELFSIKKEFKQIENNKPPKAPKPKPGNEKIDFKLINRFKNAILEDNFRLDEVYQDYYSGLEKIKTLKQLHKKYPKIKTPPTPQEVIAKKIVDTLTRDFYEEFSNECDKSSSDGFKFLDKKISQLLDEISTKFNIDPDFLYVKTAGAIHLAIVDKYKNAVLNGFSNLHEKRKNTVPQITETDLKLLALNFDNIVLSTLKQQYLESKKLNDITYTYKNTTIPIKSLSNTEYKFEKVHEKPLTLVKLAEKIRLGQRSYELFDHDKLHQRLNYYATTELADNEELLINMLNFSQCAPQDRENFIKLLKELDNVADGNKTVKEILEKIETERIKPIETQRLNEEEQQKEIERVKLEQQKLKELNNLKSKFDTTIDILYLNDMNGIASVCSKYRPESLNPQTTADASFLIKTIAQNTNENSEINKPKVESIITNWDILKFYENNDPQNPIYIKALAYGTTPDGETDKLKAGQYITNSEIINSYPQSREFVKNPDLLEKIITRSQDPEESIIALCKLNDYNIADTALKSSVSELTKMFDTKKLSEKLILKNIIENEYSNIDTTAELKLNETESVTSAMCASTKKAIIEKYKFPNCLEYLEAFENALSRLAGARGSSGVKQTGRNNESQEYKMELKISGHDDRLFSSGNNFYFDIFSEHGLH